MVTAETAVAIPAVVLVLALGLAGVRLGLDEIRCLDAARAGARAAARGDAPDQVVALARRGAPAGAEVTVTPQGRFVRVTVAAPRPAGAPPGLPSAGGEAVAERDDPAVWGTP